MPQPALTTLNMQRSARQLELSYNDGSSYQLSYEFLRVHSPSAEVKGHGPGQEVLQTGKKDVMIVSIESIGNYAVRLFFDDSHDTGIYSWDYLYELATHKDKYWENYLQRLNLANKSRENPQAAKLRVVQTFDPSKTQH